ncbi:hypothetical protein LCGC14_1132100, partial [marine sediment metagenome]
NSVTRTPVTETNDNVTGDRETSDGTDATITVIFKNINSVFEWKEQGEEKGATTQIFFAAATTLNKEDKITFQGLTFRVKAVNGRFDGGGTKIFQKARLEAMK